MFGVSGVNFSSADLKGALLFANTFTNTNFTSANLTTPTSGTTPITGTSTVTGATPEPYDVSRLHQQQQRRWYLCRPQVLTGPQTSSPLNLRTPDLETPVASAVSSRGPWAHWFKYSDCSWGVSRRVTVFSAWVVRVPSDRTSMDQIRRVPSTVAVRMRRDRPD